VSSGFREEDLLPLSALQHLLYCERQCALIHIEQVWVENRLTAEGRLLHERTDRGPGETRGDVRIARGVPLHSFRLGISGKADVVEFHRVHECVTEAPGVEDSSGAESVWLPFPVEYKRGRSKLMRGDEVQLCAQAMCLEEMLNVSVPEGALFYGQTRRRKNVSFDEELRRITAEAAIRLHELISSGRTPPAVRAPKCDACSLRPVCLPDTFARSARKYLERAIHDALGQDEGGSN